MEPNLPPPQTTKKPGIQPMFLMENKVFQVKMKVGFQHFRALRSVSTMQTKPVQQQLCFLLQKIPPQFPSLGSCCFFFFVVLILGNTTSSSSKKQTKKISRQREAAEKKNQKNFPALRELLVFSVRFQYFFFHQGTVPGLTRTGRPGINFALGIFRVF